MSSNNNNQSKTKRTKQWSDAEIVEAAQRDAQLFGGKIVETWKEGKFNPVQQLDDAIDRMEFKPTVQQKKSEK